MKDRKEKEGKSDSENARADKAALELMKQLIALASGVLALSATFIERFQDLSIFLLILLALSWLALVISIFFGLETISAIVQSRLHPGETDWSAGYGRTSALISKYGFFGGITIFAIFAFFSIV